MGRGGARVRAGRPKGIGESTKPIRVPISLISPLQAYITHQGYQLPLYASKVPAGFPSPADDHLEAKLDLNQYLIRHPAATFFVRASGDSMIGAGIQDGDILVVDRSLEPVEGKIVIAAVGGELTVKRLSLKHGKQQLLPANDRYAPLDVNPELGIHIWGVVTTVIHAV